ncbi:MAG: SpoIID/LytB domain-containing protein [Chloroflexi bacterium]|nr:SpoIID/LytB domain-containing protein [Chloroflexota bacterium]
MTIRVGITPYIHCGDWLANDKEITEIIEMDFREYVKNVLPNEWPNAWPTESLRAGAIAVKMFGWWRYNVVRLAPGARPEGVDVVDNTCDMVFFPNSAKPTTNAAVDHTWPYRATFNGIVQETHFLSTQALCDAYNFPRCMPQWGTKDMADLGALWPEIVTQYFQPIDILQTADIPVGTNVVKNPSFDAGTSEWLVTGAQGTTVLSGVFNFYRGVGSPNPAILRQDIPTIISANSKLKLVVKLGNSSAQAKTMRVRLQRADGAQTIANCSFTVPPNSPPIKHTVWAVTPAGWGGIRVEFSGMSDDGLAAYLIDDVKLKYQPTGDASVPCIVPVPGKPTVLSPLAGLSYGLDITVLVAEGDSNYVEGYDAAFHIQIDNSAAFTSPEFDNGASLAQDPLIPVSLPAGRWYLRARQFDGVDRYSKWTKSVSFLAIDLPETPTLIAPIGDVPATGQSLIWTAASGADLYKVVIKDPAGTAVYKAKEPPLSFNCSSTCVVPIDSLGVALQASVPYTWKVVAFNENGKVKSAPNTFTLVN